MITTNSITAAYSVHSRSSGTIGSAVQTGRSAKYQPVDVVEFSASALAVSGGERLSVQNPAMFENSEQLKGNLNRILMETLFGKETTEQSEQSESVEEELVRTLISDPIADEIMADLSVQQAHI
ncbi:MAG: hypothetical protein HQL67_05740 [Magnetococcales bacterium]|nr:hypothetical protein [Magnetococcales bacterium]